MLAFLTLQLSGLVGQAQTITREDLRKTVVHMQKLAKELQADLSAAEADKVQLSEHLAFAGDNLRLADERALKLQGDINLQAKQLAAETERADKEKDRADDERRKGIQAGRERDVFVVLFAIAAAVVACYALWPWSLNLPGWYALAVSAAIPVLAFGSGFLAVRLLVSRIVTMITL